MDFVTFVVKVFIVWILSFSPVRSFAYVLLFPNSCYN